MKAVSSAQTGYTLSGWFINGDYSGNAWNFAADKVTEGIILYAKWTPEKYTISWKKDNGEVATTSSVAYGTLPVCPDESKDHNLLDILKEYINIFKDEDSEENAESKDSTKKQPCETQD